MATLQELIAQREAIEKQITNARKQERTAAVSQVRALVAQFGLTRSDVFGRAGNTPRASTGKVAPKYRDPATGNEWTGRGKAPKWLEGKDRNKFLIT